MAYQMLFKTFITIAPALLSLFSITRNISTSFRRTFWYYDFYESLLDIIKDLIKELTCKEINFSNIFQILERIVFYIISTFYAFIENFHESVRVCMNRVDHDFSWNVLKSTGFIFRKCLFEFYHFVLEIANTKFFFAIN